jgi:MFS family permease
MKKGFYTIMSAQFFSSLADNALLVAAIEMLKTTNAPSWNIPALGPMFALFYVILAPFLGAFADAVPKGKVMFFSNGIKVGGCLLMLFGGHPLVAYAIVGLGQVEQREAVGALQAGVGALDAVAVGVRLDDGPDLGLGRGCASARQVVGQGLGMDQGFDGTRHRTILPARPLPLWARIDGAQVTARVRGNPAFRSCPNVTRLRRQFRQVRPPPPV